MKLAYVLLCMAAMPLPVVADEFYQAEAYRDSKGIPYPNHLTPVGPRIHPRYREYWNRFEDHLFQTDADIAQYVVRPSFGPESCVSIWSEVPKDAEEEFGLFAYVPKERKKYYITVTRVSESLWYSIAKNNDDRKTRSVETSRVDREISLELAVAIQWAWGRLLHHTRYPATALVDGKDGCTYEFSSWVSGIGNVRGETWSPQGGLTAEIVSLGDEISVFASEKEASEEPLLKLLEDFEAKIPEVEPSPVFEQQPTEGPVDPFALTKDVENAAEQPANRSVVKKK